MTVKGRKCRYCGKKATVKEKVKVGFLGKTHIETWYLCKDGFKCKGKSKKKK